MRLAPSLLLSAVLLAGISATTSAQIPRTISFQGILVTPDGRSIADGTHTLIVSLYSTATGGIPLFVETEYLPVVNGVVNCIIGANTFGGIPASLKFNTSSWVGISIDGGTELSPRTAMTSVPYALHAAIADSLSTSAVGNVVTSLNGKTGELSLQGAGGTTITQSGNVLTISSSGGSGGSGIQGVQSTDGTIAVQNPNGPTATIGVADNSITSAKILDGTVSTADIGDGQVTLPKLNASGATTGQVLTYNGSSLGFASPIGLALPFAATLSSSSDLFSITNSGAGRAGFFRNSTANGVLPALEAQSSNHSPALLGTASIATGTSYGVYGNYTGSSTQGYGVYGISPAGIGTSGITNAGIGVSGTSTDTTSAQVSVGVFGGAQAASSIAVQASNVRGTALNASTSTGRAGVFNVTLGSATQNAVEVTTAGANGNAVMAARTSGTGIDAAVYGVTSSTTVGTSAVAGASGVTGVISANAPGAFSAGVRGINNSSNGSGMGVSGFHASAGSGVYGEATNGTGVRAQASTGGNALVAIYTGNLPRSSVGADNIAIFQATPIGGGVPLNQARIDRAGAGFFNGGTFTAGADVAEAFSVTGERASYEPGDVLAISQVSDRTVERSSTPYSTLVVGVYATKPGVTLSERGIDDPQSDLVPMGVIGVIPTKVTLENGTIHRGDLIVSSSKPGYAMRGDPSVAKELPGCIIGKALDNFDGTGNGKIRVLVNVK